MPLPIRTTLDDIQTVCGYLSTKPTGAAVAEARTVIDASALDGRKLSALKTWGFIEDADGRLKVTESGRRVARGGGAERAPTLRRVIKIVAPYRAIIERAAHRGEESLTATDVAAHWHEHFRGEVADNDKTLNDQAVCFFQLVHGAGLGNLTIGRKGSPTRIDLNTTAVEEFIQDQAALPPEGPEPHPDGPGNVPRIPLGAVAGDERVESDKLTPASLKKNNRVFITHGRNKKIVAQLKEIVQFGKLEAVVAEEHETPSKPVPDKVMDDMRACSAGVIHVASEKVLNDDDGKKHHIINENVLIEIGAAMALYGRNFILLVEDGLQLPSNLQGLYQCRYAGDKLDGEATMKLLKAFNEFR
jgi:hypothetical protein